MKIYAVSYGDYKGCYNDEVITPVQAGSVIYDTDRIALKDSGEIDISHKNRVYNELSAIYYVWKNLSVEQQKIGFCHYRRYFVNAGVFSFQLLRASRKLPLPKAIIKKIYNRFLSKATGYILRITKEVDAIFPKKIKLPITLREHYCLYHNPKHYDAMMKIIEIDFSYLHDTATKCSNEHSGYFFNMFVLNSSYFDDFCSELFRFTSLVEEYVFCYDEKNTERYIGYLSERFANFYFHYLITQKNISYVEMNVLLIKNEVFL